MIYKFELGHNAMEAAKNIYSTKDEGVFHYNTVTRRFKKFYSGYKDFDDQTRSSQPESVDSEAGFQAKGGCENTKVAGGADRLMRTANVKSDTQPSGHSQVEQKKRNKKQTQGGCKEKTKQ